MQRNIPHVYIYIVYTNCLNIQPPPARPALRSPQFVPRAPETAWAVRWPGEEARWFLYHGTQAWLDYHNLRPRESSSGTCYAGSLSSQHDMNQVIILPRIQSCVSLVSALCCSHSLFEEFKSLRNRSPHRCFRNQYYVGSVSLRCFPFEHRMAASNFKL